MRYQQQIAEFIGTSSRVAVREFTSVLREVRQHYVDQANENNQAIADTFAFFGVSPAAWGAIIRKLRSGTDVNQIERFDELAAYASRTYRHLMPASGESDSGTNEQAFEAWLVRGYIDAPAVTDDSIMLEAAERVGEGFFEHFASVPF